MRTIIEIRSQKRSEFIDMTASIEEAVKKSAVSHGICYVFVPHTTAAVTVNESADPDVIRDIQAHLSRLVPSSGDYAHFEGNSDAHIKASMLGMSETLAIEDGNLLLGTWQGVFFCEFDGPRNRKVHIRIISHDLI